MILPLLKLLGLCTRDSIKVERTSLHLTHQLHPAAIDHTGELLNDAERLRTKAGRATAADHYRLLALEDVGKCG